MANDPAISEYGLVVEEQPRGVGELKLEQAPRQARLALAQHRLAADEVTEPATAFLGFYDKAQPRLEHMILVGDVVSEMAIGLLEAQRIQRQQSRRPKSLRPACLQQNGQQMSGKLARHIQFVTKLADIADAMGPHVGHADLERALCCERECYIRDVVRGKSLQEDASLWPHYGETRLAARHVDCRAARFLGHVTFEPGDIAAKRGRSRYGQKRSLREPRHRDVGLDAAALIQPLRVNDPTRSDRDIVGTDAL